jgi:hypothetical protein
MTRGFLRHPRRQANCSLFYHHIEGYVRSEIGWPIDSALPDNERGSKGDFMDEIKKQSAESSDAAAPASPELSESAMEQVAGGADALPKESISLNFTKIEFKYNQQQ